jgi:hypothetical protein
MKFVILLVAVTFSVSANAEYDWNYPPTLRGEYKSTEQVVLESQIFTIQNELFRQRIRDEEYQRESLEEMRKANKLKQRELDLEEEREYSNTLRNLVPDD